MNIKGLHIKNIKYCINKDILRNKGYEKSTFIPLKYFKDTPTAILFCMFLEEELREEDLYNGDVILGTLDDQYNDKLIEGIIIPEYSLDDKQIRRLMLKFFTPHEYYDPINRTMPTKSARK